VFDLTRGDFFKALMISPSLMINQSVENHGSVKLTDQEIYETVRAMLNDKDGCVWFDSMLQPFLVHARRVNQSEKDTRLIAMMIIYVSDSLGFHELSDRVREDIKLGIL
jgi:hypothetical protein